jgi:alpha-galactosidase
MIELLPVTSRHVKTWITAEGTVAVRAWSWGDGPLRLRFEVQPDETLRLRFETRSDETLPPPFETRSDETLPPPFETQSDETLPPRSLDAGVPVADPGLPPLDVLTTGDGRRWSGFRYTESTIGPRMRYRGHHESSDAAWRRLELWLEDPATGLRAALVYRSPVDACVVRAFARLSHHGREPVVLEAVTSLVLAGLPGIEDIDVYRADSDWLAENRWTRRPVRDLLPNVDGRTHGASPRGCFGLTSAGGWSTGRHLPMGALADRRTGRAWLWQIEHNGGWHWQVGEYRGGLYLALLGPTDAEHQWRMVLRPGDSFETVPVAVAATDHGFDDAVAGMTRYRRAVRRPHPDHAALPVVFNDYMNTLMGDPTTERLLPLIDAVAKVGVEYFCIDAGWYAERDEAWWGTVGAWRPSRSRFPGGIEVVLDRIRSAGLVAGLWLEPEVVGVDSPIAGELPAEAFFQRAGVRVVENGRYHLDLRHPAATAHLDRVVDRLVGELGIGYLKLDYNINIGPGTDAAGDSAGAGLLGHNRALLGWLDGVLDRHPALVIENCASGAMRSDAAMLARFQLQSTSDQQDFLRYPPIAAGAPVAINPEQCGNWAYPQPSFTANEIGFTLCTALLGRLYLSGHLDRMEPDQLELVTRAVDVYKGIRSQLANGLPFWPAGLPGWEDPVLALGMRTPAASYVVVWSRGSDQPEVSLPIAHLAGAEVGARVLFPPDADVRLGWEPEPARLLVRMGGSPAACLIALDPRMSTMDDRC